MLSKVATIAERIGRLQAQPDVLLHLRRVNRVRTIQGSLAIEGNTLTEAQITAILEGKRVIAPPGEIQEVRNAVAVYEHLTQWNPHKQSDLLTAHAMLIQGLLESAGRYRTSGVGVMGRQEVVHVAPPASRVADLMLDLFQWLKTSDLHPLITSSIFHYEFEFIHPFEDGNGRMGRFWQTLLLSHWHAQFVDLPIESMIYARQRDYYLALNASTSTSDAAPFVSFMLEVILSTLDSLGTTQTGTKSGPSRDQVEIMRNCMTERAITELMAIVGRTNRTKFRDHVLRPMLDADWLEMTIPDKPRSSKQKYRLTEKGRQLLSSLGPES